MPNRSSSGSFKRQIGLSTALDNFKRQTQTGVRARYFDSVILPDYEFPAEKGGKRVTRTVSLHTLKKNSFKKLVGRFKVKSSVLSRLHLGRTVGEKDVFMMTVRLTPKQAQLAFSKVALEKLGLSSGEVKLVRNSGGTPNFHTVFTEKPEAAALILRYLHSRFPS